MLVDAPLVIDTTDPIALEAGLKAYPGRALINSVSAEPERLEVFLPLAKKIWSCHLMFTYCTWRRPGDCTRTLTYY